MSNANKMYLTYSSVLFHYISLEFSQPLANEHNAKLRLAMSYIPTLYLYMIVLCVPLTSVYHVRNVSDRIVSETNTTFL